MQLLSCLQIFKRAALKNYKSPERNYVEEGKQKHPPRFTLQFWGGRDWESKVFK